MATETVAKEMVENVTEEVAETEIVFLVFWLKLAHSSDFLVKLSMFISMNFLYGFVNKNYNFGLILINISQNDLFKTVRHQLFK